MKLGSQTGSLINHVMSLSSVLPKVGDGATLLSWSDRYPATVMEVFTRGQADYVCVRTNSYKRIDNNGLSEAQEYEYTEDPNGTLYYFVQRYGEWTEAILNPTTGRFNKVQRGMGISFGRREAYYDFTF